MARTVAVTGSTGLVGRPLVEALLARGDRVIALVREPSRARLPASVELRRWDTSAPAAPLAGADAVVHLAGVPVAEKRWTAERKREIEESRVSGTRSVVLGMKAAGAVRVLVSASGIDASGDTGDREVDDEAGYGEGFLAEVSRRWEQEALAARELGARVVLLRTGLVLSGAGGALARMKGPFSLGLGGPVGPGTQWVPWIHLDDEVGLVLHALDRDELSGPLVCAAPAPVRNKDFGKALGRALHRPAFMPVPSLGLRVAFGEVTEALLASHRAAPKKALATGYRFRFPELDGALRDALAR